MTATDTPAPAAAAGTRAQTELAALTWPTPATELTGTVSLPDLLVGLQLQGNDADRAAATATTAWDGSTPASLQVIKAGALAITQAWTKRVAVAGGATAVISGATGAVTAWQKGLPVAVTVALIGAAGLVAAGTAIALALFVAADLRARATATAARSAGRAEVTAAFLAATGAASAPVAIPPQRASGAANGAATGIALPDTGGVDPAQLLAALACYPQQLQVLSGSGWQRVLGMRLDPGEGLQLKVDGDWLPLNKITGYTSSR